MLASAKDETMQLAEEKLQTIAKQANDNVEVAPVEEEAHGFLGKFNSNMNEVINADDLAKQEAEKAQKKVELSAQITTEFAPKLAESAIAEALGVHSSKLSQNQQNLYAANKAQNQVSSADKADLKKQLFSKMGLPKSEKITMQTE